MTSRGLVEKDFRQVGEFIGRALEAALEVLQGILGSDNSMKHPNDFVNEVCESLISVQKQAAAEAEETWDEGMEEEYWEEGADEVWQEEGAADAGGEDAAPAAKRQKVDTAEASLSGYEDKLPPVVSKRVVQLNKVLKAPLDLQHCGDSLAQLGADEALELLAQLPASSEVKNPTAWIIAQVSKRDAGGGGGDGRRDPKENPRTQRVMQMLSDKQMAKKGAEGKGKGKNKGKGKEKGKKGPGRDAGGQQQLTSAELRVAKTLTQINKDAGWNLVYRRQKPFLDLLSHEGQLVLLNNLIANKDTIEDPARWLQVGCAKKAKSGEKGKGKGTGKD